jgi:site-specific recombinase XerD
MFSKFERYVRHVKNRKTEGTEQQRQRVLGQFSEWLREQGIENVEDVQKVDVEDYVFHLADEGYAVNTIMRSKYSSVSAAFTWLYNEGKIDEDPTDRLSPSTLEDDVGRMVLSVEEKKASNDEKDYLSEDEVYELAENHVPDPVDRNELLVKLLFWTGCRVSTALGTRRDNDGLVGGIKIGEDGTLNGEGSDIEPQRPAIEVYAPKTDSTRVVSYPREEINPLLRDWVNHGRLRYKCMSETDRLFIGPKGPLTESGVKRVINEAAENMGIQEVKREAKDGREYHRVTPHLLRHSHAMHYHNEEGVQLDTLKDHLGHSSVNTTEDFYAEGTEDKMVETFGE